MSDSSSSTQSPLVEFAAGAVIFEEGTGGTHLYLVESGKVELVRGSGSDARRVDLVETGHVFGEAGALNSTPRATTARAVEDCKLLPLDAPAMKQLLRKHPECGVLMLSSLARRTEAYERAEPTPAPAPAAQPAAAPPEPAPAAPEPPPAAPPPPSAPPPAPEASPPAPAAPVAAFLEHSGTKTRFDLKPEGTHLIGRYDRATDNSPEVDLDAIDTGRTLSRRHARISWSDNGYALSEEPGVSNGTYLGGDRLAAGESRALSDGDVVRVGRVELTFRTE